MNYEQDGVYEGVKIMHGAGHHNGASLDEMHSFRQLRAKAYSTHTHIYLHAKRGANISQKEAFVPFFLLRVSCF